jgi:peptide/nickel transport system substrate-binding protein
MTIAVQAEPQSLDPAKDDTGDGLYAAELLYAPLIHETYQGTFTPALATSWGYVGTGNTEFQVTLRSGALFSDGTPVTAQAVVNSLEYTSKGSANAGSVLPGLTATATSANTVLLKTPEPIANFPAALSQVNLVGDIICPSALSNPSTIASAPCGAGPYVLNSSATVPGTVYAFSPNPKYYDQSAIHYKSFSLKVIASPSSALSAVQTGQAQVITYLDSTLQQYSAAKGAGLQVDVAGETDFIPIWIMDRFGTLVKPLGNVMVRQALNYAVHRNQIAKAVFGPLGAFDDEPTTAGHTGYVQADANYYSYNLAKAKSLLAQAGYPNGFSMNIIYVSTMTPIQEALQAVVQEWGQIGVKVTLVPESGFPSFSPAQATKQYAAFSLGPWGGPFPATADLVWIGHTGANAFYATPAAALTLWNTAETASQSAYPADLQAFTDYTIKNAWFIDLGATKTFTIAAKGVAGLPPAGNSLPADFDVLSLEG